MQINNSSLYTVRMQDRALCSLYYTRYSLFYINDLHSAGTAAGIQMEAAATVFHKVPTQRKQMNCLIRTAASGRLLLKTFHLNTLKTSPVCFSKYLNLLQRQPSPFSHRKVTLDNCRVHRSSLGLIMKLFQ